MEPERITMDTMVRVREHHRIAERRGMVGRIVEHYGGDGDVVVEVLFSDRLRWLLWPKDLEEEISSPPAMAAFANRQWLAEDEPVQEIDKS
jgi:hypothetical protein